MDETTAAKTAAGISSLTLALLGVSHYALIWGFVGALAALYQHRERLGPLRAICFVVLSTFCGAAMATWSISYLAVETRPVLIGLSLVAGFGAQIILTAILKGLLHRVRQLGGDER